MGDVVNPGATPETEGRLAFLAGQQVTANPYELESLEAQYWHWGWNEEAKDLDAWLDKQP